MFDPDRDFQSAYYESNLTKVEVATGTLSAHRNPEWKPSNCKFGGMINLIFGETVEEGNVIIVILPDLSQPDKVITSFGFQNRLNIRTFHTASLANPRDARKKRGTPGASL